MPMKHEAEVSTCPSLVGPNKSDKGQVRTVALLPVNLYEFEELGAIGSRVIRAFSSRAKHGADCRPEECFEPFIFGWIALNGWASCVTGTDFDRDYLKALMLDRELNNRFSSVRDGADFHVSLEEFRSYWPILRPTPLRRTSDHFQTRQDRILHAFTHPGKDFRFRPECASQHIERGEQIPADWPHTLSAIYQVRCNLFHGSKSLDSDIDTQIVFNAFRVLVRILIMLGI